MTKTVVRAGKSQRAGVVGAGMSSAGMKITSELQTELPDAAGAVSDYERLVSTVGTAVFPTLQGTMYPGSNTGTW